MTVRRIVLALVLAIAVLATAAVAMATRGSATSTSSPAAVGTGTASKAKSVCGLGNGKKATGTPIKIGAIATKQPGTDFTDIPNMANAYFQCVNANGGIYGHPIKYYIETEQTDPGQVASLVRKLVQTDHVVGMVGNTSIIECAINHKYYETHGIYMIGSGIAPECYSTSHIAAVNMGPRYSSDGAVQYEIGAGVKKIVFDQSNVPGTGYIYAGPQAVAKAAKVPIVGFTDNVPIQDANSVAVKLVQAAGSNGGVVLNFTPDQALLILAAVQKLGLTTKVKAWSCSTPCNSDFVAQALGTAWDGIFGVNAELNLPSASGPDSTLYRQVIAKYKPPLAFGLGSFSQMGFVEARIAVSALLNMKAPYTLKRVNQAFAGVKNYHTDILCKPWYFGKIPLHIPNNTDRTVTPNHGKMVVKQGCFNISAADPGIAKARALEKRFKLNTGKPYPVK
ncbi:MAG TPA: ABC transporter substrate-binding protein [Gaiellaceae bacterium]|jgi:branched-chain amino acid transport system substrate-binding protein|nr:ABC transporter substrate-binding protein [Gaiellaceae bacterium]